MSPEAVDSLAKPVTGGETLPQVFGIPRVVRAIFSFPVFLAYSLIALTAISVRDRFDDPDLWWHLKLGQIIWTTHSIPTTEIFSHTAAGHPWIPHEWLSQLSMFLAYRISAYSGLMLWLLTFTSVLLILLYGYSYAYAKNAKIAFLGAVIGWYFATVGMAIRPLMLGHILLIVELLVLQLGRTTNSRWFWALPPLFGIWVNCHGSYSIGLLILLITLSCAFLTLRVGPIVSSAWLPQPRRTLILASIASGVALFCNPMGWKLLTYPLNVLFLQHTGLSSVEEWQPLPLLDLRAAGLLLILGAIALAAAARKIEIRVEESLLLSIGGVLAVQHQRMLFLFGILAAPVVCRLLAHSWTGYDSKRDLPVANAVGIVIAIVVVVASFPSQAELASQVVKDSPVGAVEFIRNANLKGPMLNDYGFGGYLIWALPEHKVFVDGRADVFDWSGVLATFKRWALLEEDPQILLNRYQIQFCVLNTGAPVGRVLPYLPGWRKAYQDAQASVFVRRSGNVVSVAVPPAVAQP